ncbi:MAG: phosphate signaling complex protein PhoU [Polyangiaceae bacterium]
MKMRNHHTSREFEAEVRGLRTSILAMGARCDHIVDLAVRAFVGDSDPVATAQEVEELDRKIDEDELDIDARVLRMLALRQPVASDLRLLTAAMRLATDLERIGDESVNVAERAREAEGLAKRAAIADVRALGEGARRMVREAIASFATEDPEAAKRVLASDSEIDDRYHSLTQSTLELVSSAPSEIRPAIAVMKVAKYLERVADHATNVAEEVIFIVTGTDARRPRRVPTALR